MNTFSIEQIMSAANTSSTKRISIPQLASLCKAVKPAQSSSLLDVNFYGKNIHENAETERLLIKLYVEANSKSSDSSNPGLENTNKFIESRLKKIDQDNDYLRSQNNKNCDDQLKKEICFFGVSALLEAGIFVGQYLLLKSRSSN